MSDTIKPAPIIAVYTGVADTKATLRLCSASELGPMVVVRRGRGENTKVRIHHQGSWT